MTADYDMEFAVIPPIVCSRKCLLKQEFQRQLDLPCRLCGLDLIKGWRADVAVGQPEISVVQEVEEFCTELNLFRFHDVNILEYREIPIGIAWPDGDIAACIAELLHRRIWILCNRLERACIQPCVCCVRSGIGILSRNQVWAVCGESGNFWRSALHGNIIENRKP